MERGGSRGFKYNGNTKQAGNGKKPSGLEKDCTEIHSPERTVVREEEEDKNT